MRKLASIQEIIDIQPIEGADKIEVATVLGWKVVVKKGEFIVGDKVVYIEIDSILPPREVFEFMAPRKYKVKTIKLRKQISQGIIFPLSILEMKKAYHIDDDVTEELGITKFLTKEEVNDLQQEQLKQGKIEKYLMRYSWFRKLRKNKRDFKGFPKFIKKTDETRIQNMPAVLKNKELFTVCEKLDGQSGTWLLIRKNRNFIEKLFKLPEYEFVVCSRNIRKGYKFDNSSYWNIAIQYDIENTLKKMIGNSKYVGIQGEIIGQGIQGNKYKVEGYDMYVFNYITPDKVYSSSEVEDKLEWHGFKTVPVIDIMYKLPDTVDEIVKYSTGKSTLLKTPREGYVFRNKDNTISFKVINPEFLLKNDE